MDIVESEKFKVVLKEVAEWGNVTCVVFNAARVQPSKLLEEAEEEIVKDFMVCAQNIENGREVANSEGLGYEYCLVHCCAMGYAHPQQAASGAETELPGHKQLVVEISVSCVLLAFDGEG